LSSLALWVVVKSCPWCACASYFQRYENARNLVSHPLESLEIAPHLTYKVPVDEYGEDGSRENVSHV
jgi:hypothetical protein